MSVSRSPQSRCLAALGALVVGAVVVVGGTGAASAAGIPTSTPSATTHVTFDYTGGTVDWTVPAGVTSVQLEAAGGEGGGASNDAGPEGYGADIGGKLAVTPGEVLAISVGGNGTDHSAGWGADGMSGGPANSASDKTRDGGGGGGATVVTDLTTGKTIVIAAGGGGAGGVSGDPENPGSAGNAGVSGFTWSGLAIPSLGGQDGGHGTDGPMGGNGGTAGASPTGTGARGVGGQGLGGNGGSGGGGVHGGGAGGGAKGCSAGGGGGAGTSSYDSTQLSAVKMSIAYTPDTARWTPTLTGAGVLISY